ncbi:low temperature requirement protein A [Rubrivirga sp.]|uniref:low temperature requirement protein A n=1 Tax=Rubrivirga sp. TaxID=1885344 RepID=UPI003B51A3E1
MDDRWLKPPLFRRADGSAVHRQATWLELFFDLVFVVAVAGLAGLLRDDLSATGLGWFAFLLFPMWWLWMDFSYYADQFDSDDVVYRLALLAVMAGILSVSRVASEIVEGGAGWGAFVFAGMYGVLCGLYVRAYRANPELRPLTGRYAVAMAVAGGLYLASAVVPAPGRFGLWLAAVAVPMVNSPVAYYQVPGLPSQLSHMPERFGLFTIIALGESVVAVAQGIAETPSTPAVLAASGAGFALAAALWWTYFIRDDASALSAELEGGRSDLLRSHVYGYAHYGVYAGVVAAGVGVEEAILAVGGEHAFVPAARWTLAGGTAVALAAMAAIHWASPHGLPGRSLALRLAVAAVLAGLAVGNVGASVALAVSAGLMVALAAVETAALPHPSSLPNEAAAEDASRSGSARP